MAKISVTLVASSTFKGHFTIIKEKRVMNAVMWKSSVSILWSAAEQQSEQVCFTM